ncbi:MAG: hypothetical protein KAY37_14105 [Phycisphaerae bacterium]|nr:hypothetical protein [Phycisphaerae bacterium]
MTANRTEITRKNKVIRAAITREVPGLAEAMRTASSRITPHAFLQRGVCGIRGATLILNLPGSQKGAVENLTAVLPALPHAVRHGVATQHIANPVMSRHRGQLLIEQFELKNILA